MSDQTPTALPCDIHGVELVDHRDRIEDRLTEIRDDISMPSWPPTELADMERGRAAPAQAKSTPAATEQKIKKLIARDQHPMFFWL